MHIVLANEWFPPESGWGGVAIWNYAMAHAYRSLDHNVTIVASRLSSAIPAISEIAGVRLHRLLVRDAYRWRRLPFLGPYVRPVQQLAYSKRVAQMIYEVHCERRVDVIEFAEVNAEGFFYARAPIAPFVVRCHTPTFVLKRYYDAREMPFNTRITGWCEKDMIRRADSLTAPSQDMARVISQECGIPSDRIAVIPNAFSWDQFLPPGDSADLSNTSTHSQDGRPITVLHVGRLERAKGVTVLADAIPRIVREIPNIRFTFIGEDRPTAKGTSQRAELKRRLEHAGACSHVGFLGAIDQPKLAEFYRRADICVVPSLLPESFSYTCAQAMAAGKPVVASRIGGIPETVEENVSGLLTEPGDSVTLADAIIHLARDPVRRERMGRAGREKVARDFDPIRVARLNLKVYEQVVSGMAI